MFYKLDEKDSELIKNVQKITFTDYELLGDFIPVDSFISIIEDLKAEIDSLEEDKENLKKEIQENYRPLSNRELYGVSDDDFIEVL